jgi:hypothetical protein
MGMKVKMKQSGSEVTLDKRFFIAKGGEGEIYAKNGVVYKVCDSGKMIPEAKIAELSVLTDPHIIRPEEVFLDTSGQPVGYTSKFVDNCYVLCQLFTKAFRLRNNVGPDTVFKLVQQMRDTIKFVHGKGVLIVDLNELNFLVDDQFRDVFFIDVNSYQTPHYPATAIMDSIRDRQMKTRADINQGTDWFSFAVVSFQMQVGIHPFKGKHPSYTDPKTALDERMKANLPIMDSSVSYPQAACQPLTVVPDPWMQWYKAVFQDGKRVAPPGVGVISTVGVVIPVKVVAGSQVFDMNKIGEFGEPVTIYYYHDGVEAAICGNDVVVNKHSYPLYSTAIKNVAFTPKSNQPVCCWMEGGMVRLHEPLSNRHIPFHCSATNIMDYDGRVYVQNGMNIIEVIFTEMSGNTLASPHVVGTCMEKNAVFYDGVVIQNLFDAHYASVFPVTKQCRQFALRELDGYRIVDAKYEGGVLMVVGVDRLGKYDRFVFRLAKDFSGYDVRKLADIVHTGLNFTVLPNGVCVSMTEDESIEVFKAEKDSGGVKQYKDPAVKGDMELSHQGPQTVFTRGKEVYTISVRKSP